jgi:16S rRNA (uracil1498-N3)-methyltransferase
MRDCEHHLFYSNNITGDTVILDNAETNHAVSVLRIKTGRQIQVTDGNGAVYNCRCADILKQSMSCEILSKTITPKITPELTLLTGLPDKDSFETILEHATALAVSRVTPIIMDHCRKPWWGSWDRLQERFTAKMIVSMKQCLYPYIPRLDAPMPLGEIIDKCEKPLIVADQYGKVLNDDDLSTRQKLTCLIGPPGGMSADELKLLESYKPLTVKIATARLRTELAATVLCSRIMTAHISNS